MSEDEVPTLEDYVNVRCSTCIHDIVPEEDRIPLVSRNLSDACRTCALGSNYSMTDEEELKASRALITVLRGMLLNTGATSPVDISAPLG